MVVGGGRGIGAALAAVGLDLIGLATLAWLQAQPRTGNDVAAVFPPWTTAEAALAEVAEADGLVVRRGILASILVVHGERPDLVRRLYAAGAWAVIDPVALGGCLVAAPAG